MSDCSVNQCIEASSAARIASAQSHLADLRINGVPFDNPLSGFMGGIDWKVEPSERIKQIFLMPIAFILFVLFDINGSCCLLDGSMGSSSKET